MAFGRSIPTSRQRRIHLQWLSVEITLSIWQVRLGFEPAAPSINRVARYADRAKPVNEKPRKAASVTRDRCRTKQFRNPNRRQVASGKGSSGVRSAPIQDTH